MAALEKIKNKDNYDMGDGYDCCAEIMRDIAEQALADLG